MEEHRLKSNIKKIYWLNGTFAAMILMPVIVPFFQSRGLSMKNIYELQAVFGGFMFLFEVPSGYFSDLVGRKKTLILSSFLHSVGFGLMAFAPNYEWLVVSEVVLALSISLFSGTDLSLLYDSLEASESKKAPIKMVGKQIFSRQTGESIAALFGGWLLLIHFEAPAIAQALIGLVPMTIAMTLYEPPRKKMAAGKTKENVVYILKSMFGHSWLLNLIVALGVFYGFATYIAIWAFQSFWAEVGVDIVYFGYLWFGTSFTIGFAARFAHKIEKKLGSSMVLAIIGLAPIIGYFGMASTFTMAGILFCFFFQLCRGLQMVIISDALNKRVSGDMRATANSIMSLGNRLLMVGLGPVVGGMIDQKGIEKTFNIMGTSYIFVFIIIVIPMIVLRKEFVPIPKNQYGR